MPRISSREPTEETKYLAWKLRKRLMEENLLHTALIYGIGTLEAHATNRNAEDWLDAYRKS